MKLLEKEEFAHSWHESVAGTRTAEQWFAETKQVYESFNLQAHYKAALIPEHQERGSGKIPNDQAGQSWQQFQPFSAYRDVEPDFKQKKNPLKKGAYLCVTGRESFANGCWARAISTTQSTTAALTTIVNLLESQPKESQVSEAN